MAAADTMDKAFWKAIDVWKRIQKINKPAKQLGDVAKKVMQGLSTGGLLKYADEPMKDCVKLGLSLREYTKPFVGKPPTYFIEECTEASPGRAEANQKALKDLQALSKFLNELSQMAGASKSLTNIIFTQVTAPSSLKGAAEKISSVTTGANMAARKKALDEFSSAIKVISQIQPNLQTAIKQVQKMP
jgi:hypothetical protein